MPPLFLISSITLPTKIAKPRVLSIQDSFSKEKKSSNIASKELTKAKPLRIKIPKTMPPKRERMTFLV
ncbi:MAG: hypothetical protein QM497_02835 [Sulfurimonas sp.]